jgi:hypothetical protein
MRAKRRVPAPRRSHPAVWTAICGRGARLPLPKTPERAILRPTTTGNPGNVGSVLIYLRERSSKGGRGHERARLHAEPVVSRDGLLYALST